jgi:hypothetical protein
MNSLNWPMLVGGALQQYVDKPVQIYTGLSQSINGKIFSSVQISGIVASGRVQKIKYYHQIN